jgi:hypothetical protein
MIGASARTWLKPGDVAATPQPSDNFVFDPN